MVKDTQIEFVIDQIVERVFEGSWKYLLFERDGQEDGLPGIVIFETRHNSPPEKGIKTAANIAYFGVFLQPQRFMITGGDAKFWSPPQFGFSFQIKTDIFSVRLIKLLALYFLKC